TPGHDTAVVALDRLTGAVVWKAHVPGNDPAAYASLAEATIHGRKQYVQFMAGGVVAVAADDGSFLWRWDRPANAVANCSTVVVCGDRVFASSDYTAGGGLVRVVREGDAFKTEEAYFGKALKNHHGGMLLLDGCLYGANGGEKEERQSGLVCLDFRSG